MSDAQLDVAFIALTHIARVKRSPLPNRADPTAGGHANCGMTSRCSLLRLGTVHAYDVGAEDIAAVAGGAAPAEDGQGMHVCVEGAPCTNVALHNSILHKERHDLRMRQWECALCLNTGAWHVCTGTMHGHGVIAGETQACPCAVVPVQQAGVHVCSMSNFVLSEHAVDPSAVEGDADGRGGGTSASRVLGGGGSVVRTTSGRDMPGWRLRARMKLRVRAEKEHKRATEGAARSSMPRKVPAMAVRRMRALRDAEHTRRPSSAPLPTQPHMHRVTSSSYMEGLRKMSYAVVKKSRSMPSFDESAVGEDAAPPTPRVRLISGEMESISLVSPAPARCPRAEAGNDARIMQHRMAISAFVALMLSSERVRIQEERMREHKRAACATIHSMINRLASTTSEAARPSWISVMGIYYRMVASTEVDDPLPRLENKWQNAAVIQYIQCLVMRMWAVVMRGYVPGDTPPPPYTDNFAACIYPLLCIAADGWSVRRPATSADAKGERMALIEPDFYARMLLPEDKSVLGLLNVQQDHDVLRCMHSALAAPFREADIRSSPERWDMVYEDVHVDTAVSCGDVGWMYTIPLFEISAKSSRF